MKAIKLVAATVLVLLMVFAGSLYLDFHWAWDLAFGAAYCLDGYGGCPWQ